MYSFYGFARSNGTYGIRNHIAVIPSVICANKVAQRIAESVHGAIALPHNCGCAQAGTDRDQTFRVLTGLGMNPNVYGVLVVGLGCETISPEKLADNISKSGKPVYCITIQNERGTLKSIEKGVRVVRKLAEEASKQTRQTADVSNLVVGTECGASDWTSGLIANPSVGVAVDLIIENGGSVILSETTEFVGAEHILANRAINTEIGGKILEIVKRYEKEVVRIYENIQNGQPTPGNIVGGITTIEEKSLGAISKGGASKIVDVVEYGERITKKGLTIMNTPGYDVESVTGMVAGGSQVIVFTTGRGTPTGNPITPVIKVTGNPLTYKKMEENIDINAGKIITFSNLSIRDVGKEIFEELLSVSSGKLTKAETFGNADLAIWRVGISL